MFPMLFPFFFGTGGGVVRSSNPRPWLALFISLLLFILVIAIFSTIGVYFHRMFGIWTGPIIAVGLVWGACWGFVACWFIDQSTSSPNAAFTTIFITCYCVSLLIALAGLFGSVIYCLGGFR